MRRTFLAALLLAGAAACHPPAKAGESAAVAAHAAAVDTSAPAGSMHVADGSAVALADVWRAHPETVLVFYRGFY